MPGAEVEPDRSKGRVLKVRGGGVDEGEEYNATAITQEALFESVRFSNFKQIFFRIGQSGFCGWYCERCCGREDICRGC